MKIIVQILRILYNNTFNKLVLLDNVKKVRNNVNSFLHHCVNNLPLDEPILEIGPQEKSCAQKLLREKFNNYKTLDIDKNSKANIIADICHMPHIGNDSFNTIICTEVLEHTRDPFQAVRELHRVLNTSGYLLITTPFNLRIHGPAPDCWRFTEEGLKILFKDKFQIVKLETLRPLIRRNMPIHYTVILKKI